MLKNIDKIEVRGAKVHNLKNINVDVPLGEIVGIAGVSGSGKSSLALGVLYSEGSRRYLDSLSTYMRRRMSQAVKADVDEVKYVPAAIALHQRPGVPGIRSTFGTSSELLNSLRLIYSRLANHRCPDCGTYLEPSLAVAAEKPLECPHCHKKFWAPSAEDLAFNSRGACPECKGTGIVHAVNREALVPDQNKTIDEGAVAPWKSLMWSLMADVVREMGVRTDVPFKDLTPEEKEIVYNGPAVKKHIIYKPKSGSPATPLDFTYFSAIKSVENALSKVKDESGMKRIERFLKMETCSHCHGSRLSEEARAPKVRGISLDEACKMTLNDLVEWSKGIPATLPKDMHPLAESIIESLLENAKRLIELGVGYLTLERASSTLSTGERQRLQLARAVRNCTTGVLYVLDEPSIGLHPANMAGLRRVMHDLVADGNSVVLVDHDTHILKDADWIIEMGPGAGKKGGKVIAKGTVKEIEEDPKSIIGGYLSGRTKTVMRKRATNESMFEFGRIHLETNAVHTVHPLKVDIPKGRLTVVTGVSGSGKTTLVLDSLVPGLEALFSGQSHPSNVRKISADGLKHVKLIDATPIGVNVRSTIATYANIHDELRKIFAKSPNAKKEGLKAGDFSYNTGKLRCPLCDGTGQISLDVQFLPDVEIKCPDCLGSRYSKEANSILHGDYSLPGLMAMGIEEALDVTRDLKTVNQRLQVLQNLGLGYLKLGEDTPSLSGGEAQRLKLASEMGRAQNETVFVFDEPSIGLHPSDVQTLLHVFQNLIDHGATVIVIEHDLDIIKNADYIIDMGPGEGEEGGRIVAAGTLEEVKKTCDSKTAKFI